MSRQETRHEKIGRHTDDWMNRRFGVDETPAKEAGITGFIFQGKTPEEIARSMLAEPKVMQPSEVVDVKRNIDIA